MTHEDAETTFAALCLRYPSKVLSVDTTHAYTEELAHYPVDVAVTAVRKLARTSERFPSIAAMISAIRAERKESGSSEEPDLSIRAQRAAQWLADIANATLAFETRQNAVENLWADTKGGDPRLLSKQNLCDLAGRTRKRVGREASYREWLVAAGWLMETGEERLPLRPSDCFIPRDELAQRMWKLVADLEAKRTSPLGGFQAIPEPLPSDYVEKWQPDSREPGVEG